MRRRSSHKTMASLVLALVLLGVSGGVNPVRGQGRALSVGAWNTMLLPWMPFEDTVTSAIAATDFDVLVLQEVWSKAAQDRIIKAVSKQYRFSYASPARTNEQPIGCDFAEPTGHLIQLATAYVNCAISHGINTQTLIQPYPVPSPFECSVYALQLTLFTPEPASQQCHACLINSMQELPADGVSPFQSVSRCGASQGNRFTMGGVNGQVILSKFPIRNVSETRFNSWLYNRVNIYATILNTNFAFGHFGYDVLADYGFPIPSYGDTQINHVNDILARSPDVVIGDFNSGPDYQPTGYNALISGGYRDLVQPQPFLTWCTPDKLFWQPCINAGSYSSSIDHILVKQNAPGTFTGRFATGFISDHDGVSAMIGGR